MSDTYQSINRNDIEARARQLRAEAAREGLLALRKAVANAFSTVFAGKVKAA
ncbi:RSP_7527 family protein [uncultured Litoreibacter sp.]|uniref:RSP_7527 family protein n=1 Tax=uncultured Litoreibacter sp. TaxID=1392394 RepID=UPI002604DC2C|nr:hypothetical protein [uncultured Litoreibacter sp.]